MLSLLPACVYRIICIEGGQVHGSAKHVLIPDRTCQYVLCINLFNAKDMYTCDLFPKKMFIFMGFFH